MLVQAEVEAELVPLELMRLHQHRAMVARDRLVLYRVQQPHMPEVVAEAQKMAAVTQAQVVQAAELLVFVVILLMVMQAQ